MNSDENGDEKYSSVFEILKLAESLDPVVDHLLEERIRIAISLTPDYPLRSLHDPIEDDPELAEIFKQADDYAEIETNNYFSNKILRGQCHFFWRVRKEYLKNIHGIVWYTPSEMNPLEFFD